MAAILACGLAASVTGGAGARVNATPAPQRRPTFAADIAPILLTHCASCHRPGQAAPFPLLTYDEARARGKEMVAATQARTMPPWLAAHGPGFPPLQDDRRLTDRQIAAIARWVENGMPAGDTRGTPPLATFALAWPLGTPDVTLSLPRRVQLPIDDTSASRNVVVPLDFPADIWITAIDYASGGPSVLRQARFFLAPPDFAVADTDVLPGVGGLLGGGTLENYSDRLFAAARTLVDLGGWVPSPSRRLLPAGLAIRVPARWNVIVQMHLQSDLIDAAEDGRLAIYFAKPQARRAVKPIDVPPAFGIAANLSIPPGDPHWSLTDTFVLPVDVEAVGARGHAHALARSMVMTASLPTGSTRGLLKIDRWDPNWPDSYYFTTPMKLPKGTTIRVEIVYDNSADNPRNLFVPPRRVVWGRRTVGEMGSMSLLIAGPTDADTRAIDDAMTEHLRELLLRKWGQTPLFNLP
jgi:mono/diheme cytochrome c family protein